MNSGMSMASLILGDVASNSNIATKPAQPKGGVVPSNAQLASIPTGSPVMAGATDKGKADNIPIFIQAQPQSFQKILAGAIANKAFQNGENVITTENKPSISGKLTQTGELTKAGELTQTGELTQPNSMPQQLIQNTAAELVGGGGKTLPENIPDNTCQQKRNAKTPEKTAGLVNIVIVQGLPVAVAGPAVNPADANPEQIVFPALQAENKPLPIIAGKQPNNIEAVLINSADKSDNVVAVDDSEAKKDNDGLAILSTKIPVANKVSNGGELTANLTKDGIAVADKPANSNIQNTVGSEGKLLNSTSSPSQQMPASASQQISASAGQQIPVPNTSLPLTQNDVGGLQASLNPDLAQVDIKGSTGEGKQTEDKSAGNQRGRKISEESADIVKGFQNAINSMAAGKYGQTANQMGTGSSNNPSFVQTLQSRADTNAGVTVNFEQLISAGNIQQTVEQATVPQMPAVDVMSQGQQKQQLMDQIFESIQSSIRQDSRQITIRLNPPELGRVFIKFQENNGHIVGILKVSESQTRYEIEKALPQLMQNLMGTGVAIKRLDVVLADQPEQQNFKEQVPQNNQEGWANNQRNLAEDNNSRRTYTDEWGTDIGYGEADADIIRLSDSFITDKAMNVLV